MPSTIYLVTGGARSGKSGYSQRLCESLSPDPVYLATSRVWDGDFAERIHRHQQDRGDQWTTIEAPMEPSQHCQSMIGKVVMVDCLTLWLTNYFLEEGVFNETLKDDEGAQNEATTERETDITNNDSDKDAPDRALTKIKAEFEKLTASWNITFVFVTNELGSGTHPSTNASRKFVDAQGWFNQYVAQKATMVVQMVSGCPNFVKQEGKTSEYETRSCFPRPKSSQSLEARLLDLHLSKRSLSMDDKGYFIIKVDREQCVIRASFHSCMKNDKGELCDLEGNKLSCHGTSPDPVKIWQCRTAKELNYEILEKWSPAKRLVTVGHACYLGREFQKAEFGLYHGASYQQD